MVTPAPDRQQRGLVLAATSCAVVVLASQLAGKAARDAIFLQWFPVTNLPLLLAVSSALSIGLTFVIARRLRRGVPVRVVQVVNVISALLLVIEWLLLDRFPRPVAIAVFMHQTLLGPILVSGFWSVVSECFDPRTARNVLGTIGTGATIGAVVGAVIAERVAALAGTDVLLPTIAGLELLATWRLSRVRRDCPVPTKDEADVLREAAHNLTKVSLLRRLALVTVVVTVAAALLDYVFKAMATEVVQRPDDLARLFATFHGVVGVLTAIVQWLLGRWALQNLGLARTLATLPGAVIIFGIAAVVAPGIGTFVALRGAENVLRNSLYREAYEVFYTPLLVDERRATKTIIDVGVERLGDVIGGLSVLAIIATAPSPTTALLVGAVVLSALGMIVALQAQQSYVEALERSLLAHAIELDPDEPRDRTTRATVEMVRRASGSFPAVPQQPVTKSSRWPRFRVRAKAPTPSIDNATRLLGELASNDNKRIRRALEESALSPAGVAFAIILLTRPGVAEAAAGAIAKVAASCIGQLVDAFHNPQLAPAIRAQLPALIVAAATERGRAELARAGLVPALCDAELEVRRAAAKGLARLRELQPELEIEDGVVFDGVRRELALEATPERLEHLATLLALALPAEPIQMAFLGLRSDDTILRGVALEYLENVLPDDIREQMWTELAIEPPELVAAKRPLEDVLAELLRLRRAERDEVVAGSDDDPMRTTQVDLPVARRAKPSDA